MISGYEQIYLDLIPRLQGCDLKEIAARLGLKYISNQKISASFLNRDYLITVDGVEPVDGKPVNVNNRSVLLYYVLSRGSGEPISSFVPLSRLTGMIEGRHALARGIMNSPLIREFGNDLAKFKTTIEKLGGNYEGITSSGSHLWLICPLPKIPMQIVFYEADEEFQADIQIMFDQSAPLFMDFECLAFLCGCLVAELIKNSI